MTLYAVIYEPVEGSDDTALTTRLARFAEARPVFGTFWLLRSDLSVADLRDTLKRQYESARRLMVFKYVPHNEMSLGAAAWAGFGEESEQWFKNTL